MPSLWLATDIEGIADADLDIWQQAFGASEQLRLKSIRAERRHREYIVGHHLLRLALDHTTPGWSHLHTIEHPEASAPFLTGPLKENIVFNLSHSIDAVCCLVADHCQLGVDIEALARPRRFLELAQGYFATEECERLSALSLEAQRDEFYRLWTLKESLIKAQRDGFNSAAAAVQFSSEPQGVPVWWSYSIAMDDRWRLALTASKSLPAIIPLYRFPDTAAVNLPIGAPLFPLSAEN